MEFAAIDYKELVPFTPTLENYKAKRTAFDCQICQNSPSQYTCPGCGIKFCSVSCCTQHKLNSKCEGKRPPFTKVDLRSEYSDKVSLEDKQFIESIRDKVGLKKTAISEGNEKEPLYVENECVLKATSSLIKDEENQLGDSLQKALVDSRIGEMPHSERFLFNNSRQRRILLVLNTKNGSDDSYHEQFSDTIFWTVDIRFLRRTNKNIDVSPEDVSSVGQKSDNHPFGLIDYSSSSDDGSEDCDEAFCIDVNESDKSTSIQNTLCAEHTVKNIPESLRVVTLLRQFLAPKANGPIISKEELNFEKMEPFMQAFTCLCDENSKTPEASLTGMGVESATNNKLKVFLDVGDLNRYYVVDPQQSLLQNLRNRFVFGHPRLTVVLDETEAPYENDFKFMSDEETKCCQEIWFRKFGENKNNRNSRPRKNIHKRRQESNNQQKFHQRQQTSHNPINKKRSNNHNRWQQQPFYPVPNQNMFTNQFYHHRNAPNIFQQPYLHPTGYFLPFEAFRDRPKPQQYRDFSSQEAE